MLGKQEKGKLFGGLGDALLLRLTLGGHRSNEVDDRIFSFPIVRGVLSVLGEQDLQVLTEDFDDSSLEPRKRKNV